MNTLQELIDSWKKNYDRCKEFENEDAYRKDYTSAAFYKLKASLLLEVIDEAEELLKQQEVMK